MLTSEVVERQRGELVTSAPQEADPFVFSTDMVRDLQLMAFVRQVLRMAFMARPALPASRGGRPLVYSEESILVTILVMAVWQLSPRQMAKRLKRWEALATACGYQPGKTISASQLSRRRAQLGLWVYFLTFCALIWVLISRGVIVGRDWVIDSTVVDAFSQRDSGTGWSFSKRFGYKKSTC